MNGKKAKAVRKAPASSVDMPLVGEIVFPDDLKQLFYAPADVSRYTTSWSDLTIAEKLEGHAAIVDTYQQLKLNFQGCVEEMAELTCVLNWKIWALYKEDEATAMVYDRLWREYANHCYETLDNDDAIRYFDLTD